MADFDDRESFRAWLDDKPRAVAVALAARSALRVLPVLGRGLDLTREDHRRDIVLPTFRATSVACFAGLWPKQATEVTAAAAARAAHAAEAVAAFAAARAAARAAAAAVAAAAPDGDAAADVAFAADAAAAAARDTAAATAARDTAAAAVWEALRQDAGFLEAETTAGRDWEDAAAALSRQVLWAPTVPDWVLEAWQGLKSDLLTGEARDEHWYIWTDWYEARLHPARPFNAEVEKARILEITDEDWDQGPAHVNGLIVEIEARFATPPKQNPHGATWALDGVRFTITSISPEIGERAADLQPLAIEALQDLRDEIGPSQQFGRLREKAERALKIADRPLSTVNEESAALWALSVWFGSYAERDDAVQANSGSFAEALEADQRLALDTAIRHLATFTRQFRTARELDQEDAEFRRSAFRIEPHREVIDAAYSAELIDEEDHETAVEIGEAAVGPAVQAEKAGAGMSATVRNLLIASVVVLTPAGIVGSEALKVVGKDAGTGLSEGLAVRDRVRRMTEDAREAVDEIINSSPPDLRRGLDPLRVPLPPRKP